MNLCWLGGQRHTSKTASAVVEPEEVESFDAIFEDDEVDVEDLDAAEVVLSRAWQDSGRGCLCVGLCCIFLILF